MLKVSGSACAFLVNAKGSLARPGPGHRRALTLIAMYSRVELAQSSRTRFVPSSVSVCLSVSVGPPPALQVVHISATGQSPATDTSPTSPQPSTLSFPRVREVAILKASSSDSQTGCAIQGM